MKFIHYFTGNDRIEVQELEGRFRISRCIEEAQERAAQNNAEYFQIFEGTNASDEVQITDIYFIRRKQIMTDKKEATTNAVTSYELSIEAMNDALEALNVATEKLGKKGSTFKDVKEALVKVTSVSHLPISIKEDVKALSDCKTKALYIQGITVLKGKILETIKLASETITNIKDAEINKTAKTETTTVELDADKLAVMAGEIRKNIETALNLHFVNGKLLKEALDMHKEAGKPASEWVEWANLSCNVKKAQAYNLVGIYNRFGQDTEYKDTSMRVLNILVHTSTDLYKKMEEECKSLALKGKLDTKAVNRLLDSYAPSKPTNTLLGYHADKKVMQNDDGYRIEGDPDTYANKALLFEKHDIKVLTATSAPAKPVSDPVDNTSRVIKESLNSDIKEPLKEEADDKDKLIADLMRQNKELLARIDELTKSVAASKPAVVMPMLPQFNSSEPHLVLGISPVAGKAEINDRYRMMALIFNAKTCPDGAKALKAAKDALIKACA